MIRLPRKASIKKLRAGSAIRRTTLVMVSIMGLVCMALSACRPIHNLPRIGPGLGDSFPTRDRYDRLFEVPVSLSETGLVAETTFTPPFRGAYITSLSIEGEKERQSKLGRYTLDHHIPLIVTIQLLDDEELLFEQASERYYFSQYHRTFAGFQFGGFSCPEDAPYGKPVTARLFVTTPAPEMDEEFGPFLFWIRKVSDY